MVRVISVHHFVSQEIQPLEEPVAAVSAAQDKLLLVLPRHEVEVRDLRRAGAPSHCFPTVDQATSIVHCTQGNYVATLERKRSRQGGEAVHARVYVNWEVAGRSNGGLRARIAGRVTPSSSQSGANTLEMIELPVKRTPNNLACCQVSGNLVLSCHMTLALFRFSIQTHDISKQKFVDFEELLSVDLSFCPSSIRLAEDVLCCSSKENLQVIRLSVAEATKEERKRSRSRLDNPSEAEPKRTKSPVRLSELSSDSPNLREKLHPDSFPVTVQLPSVAETNRNLTPSQLLNVTSKLGPFRDATSDLNAKISFVSDKQLEVRLVKVLSLQLHTCSQAAKDEFKCLQLLPMYADIEKDTGVSLPLVSRYAGNLVSLAVAITTQQEGYVYHIDYRGLVSGLSEQSVIANPTIYSFTAPISCLALEKSIVHALTETGLESYTGRAGHHLLRSLGRLASDEFAVNHPAIEEPVCLVGLRPFFSVEHILLSENYLCLLACADPSSASSQDSQGGCNWTLYSLRLPGAAELYEDMLQLANVHKGGAPSTYAHLLLEAHSTLGTARRCLTWRLDAQAGVAVASPGCEATPEADRRLQRCFHDSCALLGDFYIAGDDESSWKLAEPFYSLSGLGAELVVDRFERAESAEVPMADEEPRERSFKGLMFYLRGALPVEEKEHRIGPQFARRLLELFERHEPSAVSALVLASPTIRQHCIDRVLQVMKKRLLVKGASSSIGSQDSLESCGSNGSGDPVDALALALLCLQKGQASQARTVLANLVEPTALTAALLEHAGLLLCGVDLRGQQQPSLAFTELALLVAEVLPEALAGLLARLTLQPQLAPRLPAPPSLVALTRAFLVTPSTALNATTVLRIYLEAFLAQLPSDYSQAEVAEGACILTRSYLACLVDKNFYSQPSEAKKDEPFGGRHAYLTQLPPFHVERAWLVLQGNHPPPELQNTRLAYEPLVKLQSLLCSTRLGQHCRFEVLQFLQAQPQVSGALGLRTLCVQPREAAALLLEQAPNALVAFAKERFTEENEWKFLVAALHKKVEQTPADSPVSFLYSRIFEDLLNHLVHTTGLEEFVRLLPAEGGQFKPFVRACENVQSANYLRSLIMETGEKLLSSLELN